MTAPVTRLRAALQTQPRFDAVYRRLGSDLRRFVAFFRDRGARQPDPEAYLDRFLASAS